MKVFMMTFTLLLTIACTTFKMISSKVIYADNSFKMNSKIENVFMGDSHAQYGFYDLDNPKNINISYRSEKYIWSYIKLRKILKSNNIKNVYLNFSYHSLSKNNEKDLVGSSRSFFYSRYCAMLGNEDIKELFKLKILNNDLLWCFLKNSLGFPYEGSRELRYLLALKRGKKTEKIFPFWGYFEKENEELNETIDVNEVLARHFSTRQVSKIQLHYLNKIIQLTNKYNVKLNLITLPVSTEYLSKIPFYYRKKHQVRVEHLKNFSHVKYQDLTGVSLEAKHFKDHDHLNMLGAKLVSKRILGVK